MTRIFLVRHGEAEGNLYRRAQGQLDAPLTRRGRQQLTCLAERFRDVPLDAVFSSDLSRAFDTARAVAETHGLPVTKDRRLREVSMGCWEDRPWGDLAWEDPEQLRLFTLDPARWHIPGGEDIGELQRRMKAAVLAHAGEYPHGAILCASHGMAGRALAALLMGLAPEDIRQVPHGDNTAVTTLEAEGGELRLLSYADASHLPEDMTAFRGQDWWKNNSGSDGRNLRYLPFDMVNGRELYLDCYRDAWREAHGSLDGFDPETCWRGALQRAKDSPQALLEARLEDRFAGLIALDERRSARRGVGWISFCYVAPALRRQSCGIQLIGSAVSRYRQLGRHALRLTAAPGNPAMDFYRWAGFRPVGREPGAREELLVLELAI